MLCKWIFLAYLDSENYTLHSIWTGGCPLSISCILKYYSFFSDEDVLKGPSQALQDQILDLQEVHCHCICVCIAYACPCPHVHVCVKDALSFSLLWFLIQNGCLNLNV